MASKSLAFVCVIFAFLVIVSQGVVAARDLTHGNVSSPELISTLFICISVFFLWQLQRSLIVWLRLGWVCCKFSMEAVNLHAMVISNDVALPWLQLTEQEVTITVVAGRAPTEDDARDGCSS
uniref:Uncharacterized protein n=1 Tax=Aegilops tauschii subsp. strangulata TaxID=200361 RepID=A0A453REC9_AEGTS